MLPRKLLHRTSWFHAFRAGPGFPAPASRVVRPSTAAIRVNTRRVAFRSRRVALLLWCHSDVSSRLLQLAVEFLAEFLGLLFDHRYDALQVFV